jgi:hypothetical protein
MLLLTMAVVLLGALLCGSAVSAQAPLHLPLQLNVPYSCPDGITMTVARCQPAGRGEICIWREEKNGQFVADRQNSRNQMDGWLKVCTLQSGTPAGRPEQALNPPYLSEMPSVERVLREMQANDPAETAARQMGTFLQLKGIIENLAGPRKYHNQMTPDETRLIGEYYAAYAHIAQSRPEYAKFPAMRGNDVSPKFRDELFQRFFSPAVRAEYAKVDAAFAAQHQARVQADNQAMETAKAQVAAAQARMAAKAQEKREIQRCIDSGRSAFECIGDKFKEEFGGLLGAIDPSLKEAFTTAPGLRLSGIWGVGTLGLFFPQDGDLVQMGCGELVHDPYAYSIVNTGTQILLKVPIQPEPVTLSYNPNGSFGGPASFALTGRVKVGERAAYGMRSDGTTGSYTEFIYEKRTVRCSAGTVALTGAAPKTGAMSVVTDLALLKDSEKSVTGSKDFTTPPGLRLIGDYISPTGFTAEFHRESATVGCRDAVVADSYAIQSTGTQVLVKIEDRAKPIVLTLGANGSLTGAGTAQISGRRLTGVKQDPMASSKDELVFASTSASCAIGTLTLAAAAPSEAEQGAAAARASLKPAGETPSPAPAEARGRAPVGQPEVSAAANATAVLSITNGFSREPGATDPLVGHSFSLLKDSLENALTKTGFRPQPGVSATLSWMSACQKGTPECQQALVAARPYIVTNAKIGPTGTATFPATPAGTYYLYGITRYNNRVLFWDLKVDLKPGANAVVINQQNAAVNR